ncbi:MAG: hypothetical protein AAFZ04_08040 [Pseudomonadota bacterium]
MIRKFLSTVAGIAVLGAPAAFADQNEILVFGNFTTEDESFAMAAYTRNFTPQGTSGLAARVSVSTLSYDLGPTDVSRRGARLALGYNIAGTTGGETSFFVGAVSERFNGSTDTDVFLAVETYQPLGSGSVGGVLEYSGVQDTFYVQARYGFAVGSAEVGPVASYVDTNGYHAYDLGVQASIPISTGAYLLPGLAYRNASPSGFSSEDSTVFSLGLYTAF